MERFKNIEPKIQVKKLENHLADEFQKVDKAQFKDPKFYIKRNMQTVMKIDKEVKKAKEEDARPKTQGHVQGKLPQYLVNKKRQ